MDEAQNLTLSKKDMTRFNLKYKVMDNNCWEWISSKNRKGYGKFWLKTKPYYAHRISYLIYRGSLPYDLFVCHTCDNPSCVNPTHLYLGTAKDNYQDMKDKGRNINLKGSSNANSKLVESQVLKIRELYKTGKFTVRGLAKDYKVSHGKIVSIINRKSWKHV